MRRITLFIVLYLAFPSLKGNAQSADLKPDSVSFFEMSLEQLLNVEVSVTSGKSLTQRESPGIVTIITDEEIRKSGASDLIEALRLVPGFDFGVDVEGVIGIAVRGNWAHEGKVLMLIDGHEINEELYSTLQFGHHYPLDLVKRIEVIRGPGSAMYGGSAEYSVINIITLNGGDLNGALISASYGQMSKTFAGRDIAIAVGKNWEHSHLSLSTWQGQGNRSEKLYTDQNDTVYSMKDQSGINTNQYRLDFSTGGLSLSSFVDLHTIHERDGYGITTPEPTTLEFMSYHFSGKYDLHAGPKTTITPGLAFKQQTPWRANDPTALPAPYNVESNKSTGYLMLKTDISNQLNLLAGVKHSIVQAEQQLPGKTFSNGNRNFYMQNSSLYAQVLYRHPWLNVACGMRYNMNNRFRSSFVPRVALTKATDKWHAKILYSKAFRAPSVENIDFSETIRPENTTVFEVETGYQIEEHSYLTANIFDINTSNVIVYYVNDAQGDAYKNEGQTGTRGFELVYKFKKKALFATVNYSFYTTGGKPVIASYQVPMYTDVLLGFPAHRVTATGGIPAGKKLTIAPTVSYQSKRFTCMVNDADQTRECIELHPSFYADLNFCFENVITSGMNISAGCFNIFDRAVWYLQPYDSNHTPLPGSSREFRIRVTYKFGNK